MGKWRPIPGFPGYFASRGGEILSTRRPIQIVMKPQPMFCGNRGLTDRHRCVLLVRDGGPRKRVSVHQLIARTFIGSPPTPAHEVNHKNGRADDNRARNLEWTTRAGNGAHAARLGLKARGKRHGLVLHPERRARGERHGRAKLTRRAVGAIRRARAGRVKVPLQVLARRHGVSISLVSQVGRGEVWRNNWKRSVPLISG